MPRRGRTHRTHSRGNLSSPKGEMGSGGESIDPLLLPGFYPTINDLEIVESRISYYENRLEILRARREDLSRSGRDRLDGMTEAEFDQRIKADEVAVKILREHEADILVLRSLATVTISPLPPRRDDVPPAEGAPPTAATGAAPAVQRRTFSNAEEDWKEYRLKLDGQPLGRKSCPPDLIPTLECFTILIRESNIKTLRSRDTTGILNATVTSGCVCSGVRKSGITDSVRRLGRELLRCLQKREWAESLEVELDRGDIVVCIIQLTRKNGQILWMDPFEAEAFS